LDLGQQYHQFTKATTNRNAGATINACPIINFITSIKSITSINTNT
jgi:hypothetical protein